MFAAQELEVEVFSPESAGGMPEVIEDQDSFRGNALKKARALASGLPEGSYALADDSGLCVDALDGAPGVYSARYAGANATDADNRSKLIAALNTFDKPGWEAHFECALALAAANGEEWVFEGRCDGRIVGEERGSGGFGYDPVFVPDGLERTFAEVSDSEKAALSHRGAALRLLRVWISEQRGW